MDTSGNGNSEKKKRKSASAALRQFLTKLRGSCDTFQSKEDYFDVLELLKKVLRTQK